MKYIKNKMVWLMLLVVNTAMAQVPGSWTVNPAAFQYQMTVTCKANQACVDLADTSNYVAAFVNGQCRGVVKTKTVVGANRLALLTIKSNVVSGENVKFQIYNAVSNAVVNVLDSVTFNQGTQLGTLNNPFMMYTNHVPTDISISATQIQENSVSGTVIANLTAADVDPGTSFTFTLTGAQAENIQFAISGNTLQVNTNFDYETDSTKTIEIMVDDNGGCTYVETFTIHIIDTNEVPSALIMNSPTINDHAVANSLMGKFFTTDEDLNDAHVYTLVAGVGSTDNATFYIQNDTLYNLGQLDYATQSTYNVRVRSTDLGGLFIENTFVINVVNVNDAPTDITLSADSVNENVAIGTLIATMLVADADLGDTHTLTLVAGAGDADNAFVAITNDSLITNANIDFETKDTLYIRIRATDAAGASYEEAFVIRVKDLNEIPSDIALSKDSISEGLPAASFVGKFSSTDVDAGSSFSYSLVTGTGSTDNAMFNIVNDSLVSAQSYVFNNQVYSIRVRTTDNGGLFYEEAFNITILDSNYVPTDIITSDTSFNENISIATVVATLSTVDVDPDTHVYTFVSGPGSADSSYFSIVGNQIVTDSLINYELKSTYNVRIKTTDQGGASYTESFVFYVNDVNETPTDIALSNDTIGEGLPIGTFVGGLTSTDEDFGATHTYSLVAGVGSTDNSLFNINGDSLITNASYVFTSQTYSIRLRTTDNGGLFYEEVFSIVVSDSNYVPTDIIPSDTTFNENIAIGTTVLTLATTDVDPDTHVYTLVSGPGSTDNLYFHIVNDSLLTDSTVNFELKNTYTIRVRTTDPGNAFYEEVLTLHVNDLNEVPTDMSITTDSINELEPAGTVIADISSVDEDFGATFTYTLVAGTGDTDNSQFTITGNQLKTASSYIFNHQTYSLRLRTTDNGGLFYEEVFTVKVLNVNETPTDIVLDTTSVNEDNEPNRLISNIKTIDVDDADTYTYNLIAGTGDTDNAQFTIWDNKLYINEKTNYDVKSVYYIRIQSIDQGGLSVDKAFEIAVNDVAGNSIPLPSTNYISPNGDGKNDLWKVDNVVIYKEFALQIFDQFGQVIYSVPSDYNNEFDGRVNGNPLPTGNYYYVFKNDKKTYSGNITIVN